MSTTDPTPKPDLRTDNYDIMLEKIDRTTEEIMDKIESGRIRNPKNEEVRLKYYRTLGYLIRTKRKVLEDKTLQELEEEIEALKER